jgi:hypothetical protein
MYRNRSTYKKAAGPYVGSISIYGEMNSTYGEMLCPYKESLGLYKEISDPYGERSGSNDEAGEVHR